MAEHLSGESTVQFPGENGVVPAIEGYQRERRRFIGIAESKGFQLLTRFDPSLIARWSFIDRPDPQVLSPLAVFHRNPVVGPVIEIYSKNIESRGHMLAKDAPGID